MFERIETGSGRILGFKVKGRLIDADYKNFVPVLEDAIKEHGKVNLFLEFEDFLGWDAKAAWDDYTTFMRFKDSIGRIAIVGENRWEKWMTKLGKLFMAEMNYYDIPETPNAWKWVREGI